MSVSGLFLELVVAGSCLCTILAIVMTFSFFRQSRARLIPLKIQKHPKSEKSLKSVLLIMALVVGGFLQWQEWQYPNESKVPAQASFIMLSDYQLLPANTYSPRALTTVTAASVAEELIASPNHPDFLNLRNFLTRKLLNSEHFDQYPLPVLIDLSAHLEKDTIKYLITERPGILSVIYYSNIGNKTNMLVYWPELVGEQLVYTPINGLANVFTRN